MTQYDDIDLGQGWGEYYSGTRLAQNDKHEYTNKANLRDLKAATGL